MGNKQTRISEKEQKKINHPVLQNSRVSEANDLICVSVCIENEKQFKKWENDLSQLARFDQYYLFLPKAYNFSKAICGSSGILEIQFDNYPHLLEEQIQNRAKSHHYFTEVQIWYLLYGLVLSASIFKKIGMKIGDVRPKNIFLNEEGHIKISNQLSWPKQNTNYKKFILENIATYLSPQEIQQSREGKVEIYSNGKNNKQKERLYDQFLCESFSIGLTLLQSALLVSNSSLYSYKDKRLQINKSQLQSRVESLLTNTGGVTKYSKSLRIAIANLCQVLPEDRLDSIQLYEHLKYNDSQITNLKPCTIEVPKSKNRQKYEKILVGSVQPNKNAGGGQNSINNYVNYNSITGTNSVELISGQPPLNYYSHISIIPKNSSQKPLESGFNSVRINQINQTRYIQSQYSTGNYINDQNLTTSKYYYTNSSNSNSNPTHGSKYIPIPTLAPIKTVYKPTFSGSTHVNAQKTGQLQSLESNKQIGTGNLYLNNIYQGSNNSIQTPTFQNLNNISFNQQFFHEENKNKEVEKRQLNFDFNTERKDMSKNMVNQEINFSNISSIPKKDLSNYESGKKLGENIGIFTPSQTGKQALVFKNSEPDINFLKKIDMEILQSQQKYN